MTSQESLPASLVRREFEQAGIFLEALEVREFPGETIIVAVVPADQFLAAQAVAPKCDAHLGASGVKGFVAVRKSDRPPDLTEMPGVVDGVGDERATRFADLLQTRSRASESKPSLAYIPDTNKTLTSVMATRHNLIFGRRGAGKTALMLEAKARLSSQGSVAVWFNLQTFRQANIDHVFLWVCEAVADEIIRLTSLRRESQVLHDAQALRAKVRDLKEKSDLGTQVSSAVVPEFNALLKRFSRLTTLYIFLDDLHYLSPKSNQALLLDRLHAITRDADVWLKVASIRHLTRWFEKEGAIGLQTTHDATLIDLDVTLQHPSRVKPFLESMLSKYAEQVGIRSLTTVLSDRALDRLVLASGAVPRDYLELTAKSIRQAQGRPNAHLVGVEDVNKTAGDHAEVKIAELEDDAAATGNADKITVALTRIRSEVLDAKRFTYFRVSFEEKENKVREYALIQSLMDLRLIHLVNPSVSDRHTAGKKYEAFMIDLSQYTGTRFKKYLNALDFKRGQITLIETGTTEPDVIGDTPKKLLAILRRGPVFSLDGLDNLQTAAEG